MQFYEPGRLIFLGWIPLLILLFFLGNLRWKERIDRLGNQRFILSRLMPEFSMGRRRLGWLFLLVVFFFSTLALARPQWGEEKKKVERKGLDVIFLLDTSLSMLAEDVKPDRLRNNENSSESLMNSVGIRDMIQPLSLRS